MKPCLLFVQRVTPRMNQKPKKMKDNAAAICMYPGGIMVVVMILPAYAAQR